MSPSCFKTHFRRHGLPNAQESQNESAILETGEDSCLLTPSPYQLLERFPHTSLIIIWSCFGAPVGWNDSLRKSKSSFMWNRDREMPRKRNLCGPAQGKGRTDRRFA